MATICDEKFVRRAIIDYLGRKGWGRNLREKATDEHGIDITVWHNRYQRCWYIEAKGDSRNKIKSLHSRQQVNFHIALGQIMTRMEVLRGNPHYKYTKKYGVGFPATYEKLVIRRLPWAICHRLNLYVFLVDNQGKVKLLDWKAIRALQKT